MNDPPSDSASDAPATEPTATDSQPSEFLFSRRLKATLTRAPPRVISLSMGIAFLVVAVGPAAAQNQVGDVYCNTGVATGIDLVFGAIAGLGLPATAFYIGTAGLSYMRAGGNPEKKNDAKEKLVMSGIGFGIVVALVSPELIDKVGSQMGFGFRLCQTILGPYSIVNEPSLKPRSIDHVCPPLHGHGACPSPREWYRRDCRCRRS